jgi:hypothetical protein
MPAVRNGKEISVATNIEVAFNLEQTFQHDVCRYGGTLPLLCGVRFNPVRIPPVAG